MTIGKALAYYWKLKAIESIEMSSDATLPEGESAQLINALIDNDQIKEILTKAISVQSSESISTNNTNNTSNNFSYEARNNNLENVTRT